MTKNFRLFTFALLFSLALNIGLIVTLVVVTSQKEENSLFALNKKKVETSNSQLLFSMSKLTFRELLSYLTNRDLVEEGYTKRDLALACLVSFHHFNLEKAISALPTQVRTLALVAGRTIDVFPALTDDEFQAIIRYAYQEKWPLTSRGLFGLLKEKTDESLYQAFSHTPEYFSLQMLFQKTGAPQKTSTLIELVKEGTFELLAPHSEFSVDTRRDLLFSYLKMGSPTAAKILLSSDFVHVLKKMDDSSTLALLSVIKHSNEDLKKFCVELLKSPRSDAIWQAAAVKLYSMNGESIPGPIDPKDALVHFTKTSSPKLQEIVSKPQDVPSQFHVVKEGESLWKISRIYKVKVDEIAKLNGIENNALRPGMTLKIP